MLVCTSPSGWSSCCPGTHRSALAGTAMSWGWRQSRWGLRRSAWSPLAGHTGSHRASTSRLEEERQEAASWKPSPFFYFFMSSFFRVAVYITSRITFLYHTNIPSAALFKIFMVNFFMSVKCRVKISCESSIQPVWMWKVASKLNVVPPFKHVFKVFFSLSIM